LLLDEEFSETARLTSCVDKVELEKIADCKQTASFEAWKFNQKKTLDWLERKVSKLSAHLIEKKFNVTQSSVAANYVKSVLDDVPESIFNIL
jgi:ribonuclease H2 subunit B